MPNKIDLSGHRYGKLLVLEYSHSNKREQSMWKCLCDCGNTKLVGIQELRRKDGRATISCGCMTGKKPHYKKDVAFNHLVYTYKKSAKDRKIAFDISDEYIRKITSLNCFYCGSAPKQVMIVKGSPDIYLYNGIDRLDSSKGYIEGNVVPCCKTCNTAKMKMPYSEFKNWILQAADYLNSKDISYA